jgi:hypothetical protein
MKRRTIVATSRFYGEEIDEERDAEMGWSNCAGIDLHGHQLPNWTIIRWAAILLVILGVGGLVYGLVEASDAILH